MKKNIQKQSAKPNYKSQSGQYQIKVGRNRHMTERELDFARKHKDKFGEGLPIYHI